MLGGGLCEATPPRILPVSLYRLTAADYSNGDSYHYTYDAVGNRLTQEKSILGLLTTATYVPDDANRLASVNGVNYAWDNNGNLLSDGIKTYTYDSANRLKAVSGQQLAISYGYNGLSDRLQEIVNGQTTTFAMDYNTGLTQVLNDGTNTYIYGNGRIAQVNAGTEYFLGDALGSVRQLTNNNGAVTYASAYDPYGVTTQTYGASQTAYGFTGEYTSNEMVYLRARYYVPGMGRFLTRDTWGGDDQIPLSFNGWNYTYSNPINYSDPSGYSVDCTGYRGLDAPLRTAMQFTAPYLLNGKAWKATGEAWKYAWNTCIDSLKKANAAFKRGDYVRAVLYSSGFAASAHQATERVGQINQELDTIWCPEASLKNKIFAGWDVGSWALGISSLITPFAYEGWLAAKGALGDALFGNLGEIGYYDEMLHPTMGNSEYYTGKYQQLPGFSWDESTWIQQRLENPMMEIEQPCHYASTCGQLKYPLYPRDVEELNQNYNLTGDLKSNMPTSDLQSGDLLTYYADNPLGSPNPRLSHSDRILSVDGTLIQGF